MPYPHTAPVTAVLPVLKISTQVNAPIAALPDLADFRSLTEIIYKLGKFSVIKNAGNPKLFGVIIFFSKHLKNK